MSRDWPDMWGYRKLALSKFSTPETQEVTFQKRRLSPTIRPSTCACLTFDTMKRLRPIIFHPKARGEIRRFPKAERSLIGRGLFRLQLGETLSMPIARPMPTVAPGVSELRVRGEDGVFRVFYFTATAKGVLVFHAFAKKTQRTPPLEIELARKRLKELIDG